MSFIIKTLPKASNRDKWNKLINLMNIKKTILKLIKKMKRMTDFILNFEDYNIFFNKIMSQPITYSSLISLSLAKFP